MLHPLRLVQEQCFIAKLDPSEVSLHPIAVSLLPLLNKVKKHADGSRESYAAAERSTHRDDFDTACQQALRLFTALKPMPVVPEHLFESARSVDRFWIVYHALTSEDVIGEAKTATILLNEKAFLPSLNDIVPVIVSCFTPDDLPLLIRPLLLSTLATKHISNLVANVPCICQDVCLLLIKCISMHVLDVRVAISVASTSTLSSASRAHNQLDHAALWRCARVLLAISARTRALALTVRDTLAQTRSLPGLCVEVSRRYVHDVGRFMDAQLSSRCCRNSSSSGSSSSRGSSISSSSSSSSSISSWWMLTADQPLLDRDLTALAHIAQDRFRTLLSSDANVLSSSSSSSSSNSSSSSSSSSKSSSSSSRSSNSSSDSASGSGVADDRVSDAWYAETHKCARMLAFLTFARSGLTTSPFAVYSSLPAPPGRESQARVGVVRDVCAGAIDAAETLVSSKGGLRRAEQLVRLCVVLIAVGLAACVAEGGEALPAVHRELQAVLRRTHAVHQVLCQTCLSDASEVGAEVGHDAKVFWLCLRVASSYGRGDMLRDLCRQELGLVHLQDLMSSDAHLSIVMTVLAALVTPHSSIAQGTRDSNAFGEEFLALRPPSVVSGTSARTGDWLTCLCWLMQVGVISPQGGRPCNGDSGNGDGSSSFGGRSRSTYNLHSMMVDDVLRRPRWPPHPAVQACVDCWLTMGRDEGVSGWGETEGLPGGLPLLQDDAISICAPLATSLDVFLDTTWTLIHGCCCPHICIASTSAPVVTSHPSVQQLCEDSAIPHSTHFTDPTCRCSTEGGTGPPAEGYVWAGVLACYAALKYTHSSLDAAKKGKSPLGTYRALPFACHLRSLPIKRALQVLLLASRVEAVHSVVEPMLSSMVGMVSSCCPELVQVRETLHCYRTALAHPRPPRSAEDHQQAVSLLLRLLADGDARRSGGAMEAIRGVARGIPLGVAHLRDLMHRACVQNLTRTTAALSSSPSSFSTLPTTSRNQSGKADALQRSTLLWTLFAALHDASPCPQEVELVAVNAILLILNDEQFQLAHGDDTTGLDAAHSLGRTGGARAGQSLKHVSSYAFLAEEPFLLFRLPRSLHALRVPFILKLVLFVTRGALRAGRVAAKQAFEDRVRVARSFVDGGLPGRSFTEGVLAITHPQGYVDLTELCAARLALSLWYGLSCRCGSNDDAGGGTSLWTEIRQALGDFLHTLCRENEHLPALLLQHQLSPRDFELLVPAIDTRIGHARIGASENDKNKEREKACSATVGHLILNNIVGSISRVTQSLPPSAINFQGSTRAAAVANMTLAAAFAVSVEIPTEDFERSLLHCLLWVRTRPQDALTTRLVPEIPSFIFHTVNCLNSHLSPSELNLCFHLIAELLTSIVSTPHLYKLCAGALADFRSEKAVSSANIAAIAQAMAAGPMARMREAGDAQQPHTCHQSVANEEKYLVRAPTVRLKALVAGIVSSTTLEDSSVVNNATCVRDFPTTTEEPVAKRLKVE